MRKLGPDRRNPRQIVRTTQHLRALARKLEPARASLWEDRYDSFIRTHIDPTYWPDDVWQHVQTIEKDRPVRRARDRYASSFEPRNEFKFGDRTFKRDEIEQMLGESLESFFRTIDTLRSEKEHFYDSRLVNPAFREHIAKAKSLEETKRAWEFARNAHDLFEPETLHLLSHRLIDFGAPEDGFECLLLAYQRAGAEYFTGSQASQVYLDELCQRNCDRVVNFLVERCERALSVEHGGFDLPRMIARFFAACGDVTSLRQVFEDYLTHCQDLFAHLPKQTLSDWLRDYRADGRNEPEQILHFIFDLIEEPEIDQAHRLVRVTSNLARARPAIVCRVFGQRFPSAEPLLGERLEPMLDSLSSLCPSELAPHLASLCPLFARPHFRLRRTLSRAIDTVAASTNVPTSVVSAAKDATRVYSPLIAYPSRRFILSEPSTAFVKFIKKGALFDFHNRIRGISELLHVSPGFILAYLERTLRAEGWNEEERKDDWYHHSDHGRVVWIVPRFHTRVSELIQKFLHEALENGRYAAVVIERLTNVTRIGDPAFVASLPKIKPPTIQVLDATDGNKWMKELETRTKPSISSISSAGWTTIHEFRRLSQTSESHPKFVSTTEVRSLFVSPVLAGRLDELSAPCTWPGDFETAHDTENLTLTEAERRALNASAEGDLSGTTLPSTIAHTNGHMFQGFRHIALIHPLWIERYNLKLADGLITAKDETIARFEKWQEGYEDDVYTRDLLSFGVRLIVSNQWLKTLLLEHERALVISTSQERVEREGLWGDKEKASIEAMSHTVLVP